MKDTTNSYDILHNQQQTQPWNNNQHRQQQHHHQQQQIANTTSVYVNHQVPSQTNAINQQQTQRAVDQHNHQAAAVVAALAGQFHQVQSTGHHNTAAYYPHLYTTYQTHAHQGQHLQGPTGDHLHHDHHPASTVASSVVGSASAVAGQHGSHVHHQQSNNAQSHSSLNHWGTAGLSHQAHHAVVSDHSTLAYMTAYQNHNTTVADHSRNSNGPLSNASLNTSAATGHHAPLGSTYAIDPLYNSSAAAASAYGYNIHNAGFFRTSNDTQHTQTAHHSNATDISSFWNHGQATQQSNAHSQVTDQQVNASHRQQLTSTDQTSSYIHDPRVYYGRQTFGGQNIQNIAQSSLHQNHHQPNDGIYQHIANLSSQHQLLPDRSVQSDPQNQLQNEHVKSDSNTHQHTSVIGQLSGNQQPTSVGSGQASKHLSAQSNVQLESISESTKAIDSTEINQNLNSNATGQDLLTSNELSRETSVGQKSQIVSKDLNKNHRSPPESQTSKPLYHSNSRADPAGQRRIGNLNNVISKRSNYMPMSEERGPLTNRPNNQIGQSRGRNHYVTTEDTSKNDSTVRNNPSTATPEPSEIKVDANEQADVAPTSLPKKTSWASIASQPAKISQPKSLKSKIAASNSVLSTAKHLAAVSLDSSSLDPKNTMNSAIKTSVATAMASIQRSTLPLSQSSRMSTIAAACKLDFGGTEGIETSKISWPAMNATAEALREEAKKNKEALAKEKDNMNNNNDTNLEGNKPNSRDGHDRNDILPKESELRERRESNYTDSSKHEYSRMGGQSYQNNNREFWDNRRDSRDYRGRKDSERRENNDKLEQRDYPRRDHRNIARSNHFHEDQQYRDKEFKKFGAGGGNMHDREREPRNTYFRGNDRNKHEQMHHQGSYNNNNNNNNRNDNALHHHSGQSTNKRDTSVGSSYNNSQVRDQPKQLNVDMNSFNPENFDLEPKDARYFIIKSYSEDDIYRSIKYSIWCSTNHGNKRLDEAYQQQSGIGPVYLFYSVNGSGRFCGMAQMTSAVDFDSSSGVWAQSKWLGEFSVKWIYVKDVPNNAFRHITLENNENKPVTNSRDTQEVPSEKGKAVLKILHQFMHTTSIIDDFIHYERKFDEEKNKKSLTSSSSSHHDNNSNHFNNGSDVRPQAEDRRFNSRPYARHNNNNHHSPNREPRASRFAS